MDIMMEAEVIRLALEVSRRDAEITQLRAELAAATDERDTLRAWDNEFRAACGFKRDGRSSPECLKEYLDRVLGELEQEREMADRLAGLLSRAPTKAVYMQLCIDALTAHATRRNK